MTARFSFDTSSSGLGFSSELGGIGVDSSMFVRGRFCRPGHYAGGCGPFLCGVPPPSFSSVPPASGSFGCGFAVPSGGLHPSLVGRGYSNGIFHSDSSQLFEAVHSPEGCFRQASNFGPLSSQSSPEEEAFQDGGPTEGSSLPLSGSLGCQAGPERRILSSASGSQSDKVLWVRPREEGVCLPSSTIWAVPSPLVVHPRPPASQEGFEETGCEDIVLSGRLSHPGSFASGSFDALQNGYRPPATLGLPDQLEEVGVGPHTTSGVSGRHGGFGGHDLFPSAGEGRESLILGGVVSPPFSQEMRVGISCGVSELRSGFCSPREAVAQACSVLDKQQFLSPGQESSHPHGQSVSGGSSPLGLPFLPGNSCSPSGSSSVSRVDDRRFLPWLGGRFGWSPSRWGLERVPTVPFHKLAGIEGCASVSAPFSSAVGRKVCFPPVRQHNYSGLYQEAGVLSLTSTLVPFCGRPFPGPAVGDSVGSSPLEGCIERPCGQSFSVHSNQYGVVPGRGFISEPLPAFGNPPSGSHGHIRERTSVPIRLSLSRLSGGVFGRLLARLGDVDFNLLVSPISAPSGGRSQIEFLPGRGVSNSPQLAFGPLVPSIGGEVSVQCSSGRGRGPFPANFTGPCRDVGGSSLPTSRLDIMRATLVGEGFSDLAADITLDCHKQSTQRQYQSSWKKFLNFLVSENLHPHALKLCHVHNFLAFESEAHSRAYKTLAAYKCALALPLKICFGLDLDGVRTTSFMKGLWNRNPPMPRPMPTWDLSDLLMFLRSDRFEDLRTISFSLLIQKVLALLLIASGRRISEIANLSLVTYVRGSRTFVEWLPGFRAKWCSGFSGFSPQSPSVCRMKSSNPGDLRNCPVRALGIYLERRASVTGRNDNRNLWTLSQSGLATSFRSLIKDSRRFVGRSVDIVMFPHQAKRFAVSYCWHYFEKVESALPARVGNKSVVVLKRSYLGPVPDIRLPCVVPLGTIKPDSSS